MSKKKNFIIIDNTKHAIIRKEENEKIMNNWNSSETLREQYKEYIGKNLWINGILVEKQKKEYFWIILLKDTGISKRPTKKKDICREEHMWIKVDNNIAEHIQIGEDCYFFGTLYPYVSKGKTNIGFCAKKLLIYEE